MPNINGASTSGALDSIQSWLLGEKCATFGPGCGATTSVHGRLLHVVEEVGELAHEERRLEDGYPFREERAKDAVGDILITLVGYCIARGWSIGDVFLCTMAEIEDRWARMRRDRDARQEYRLMVGEADDGAGCYDGPDSSNDGRREVDVVGDWKTAAALAQELGVSIATVRSIALHTRVHDKPMVSCVYSPNDAVMIANAVKCAKNDALSDTERGESSGGMADTMREIHAYVRSESVEWKEGQ